MRSGAATEAEQVGTRLAESDARTARDLALATYQDVVSARGDRFSGGAELVVRIVERSFGHDAHTVCWRYQVEGRPTTVVPEPTSCPSGGAPVVAGNYGDNLAGFVLGLPPEDQRRARTICPEVERAVDAYVSGGDLEVEVADIGPGVVGVALRLSVTGCTFTRIEPAGPETRFTTWQADPDRLGSGTPGCHPKGAVP